MEYAIRNVDILDGIIYFALLIIALLILAEIKCFVETRSSNFHPVPEIDIVIRLMIQNNTL